MNRFKKFIPGTNILPCKVFLLDERWEEFASGEHAWDLMTLIEFLEKENKKISLILDLNRSNVYYNFEEFIKDHPEHDYIRYERVSLEDNEVPNSKEVEKIHQIMDEHFDGEDNDDVIVIHCFNGRNRTGYAVCSYLCKKLNISGEKAIKLFQEARGLQFEHEKLTEDLKLRYP